MMAREHYPQDLSLDNLLDKLNTCEDK